MSLASSILKGDRAVYRFLGRREWFSRNEGPRRFLATIPAKVPPQPTDTQKTDAGTAPASTPKVQSPSPAAPRPAPSTSSSVNAGQKVAPAGQKVQTPPSPPKAPASSAQTPAPGQKAQPSQAPPAAQKVTPVVPVSPVPKVQASSPPPGQKAPPSQAPPPPSGSKGASPPVPANNRRKVLFASVATAGLVSAILYWQSSFLDAQRVPDRAATATTDLKDKNDGDPGDALVQDAEAQQSVFDAEEKTSEQSENIQQQDGSGSGEETREAAVESSRSSAKGEEHHERQQTLLPETPTSDERGHEEHSTSVLQWNQPKDPESSTTTVSASDGPLKVEVESSPEELKVVIEEQGGGSDAQVITAVIPAEEVSESSSVSHRPESAQDRLVTEQRSDALPERPEVTSAHIDVITAIHAAEKRQAEIDAAIFGEQLETIFSKHQHELRDVEHTARSYKEQLHRVEEGMDLEKLRHAEELKQQQQQAERKLQSELKLRDEEAQQKLEEAQLLSKAEALASIAEERAVVLRDIGSIKLQMEAMNHALDSKSEEAREGHTVTKLSLGTFALESALRTGSPVTRDVSFLLETAGGDPLVEATVHSLPKDVVERGTLTPAQLDRELDEYKTTLTELALIPVEGGGVLSHLLARLASLLKVSERGLAEPEGVEAVLYQVENHVKEGRLVEAAELLEKGLAGTSAQKLASQWAIQARNRAILEQACALLRAHAAAIAVGRG